MDGKRKGREGGKVKVDVGSPGRRQRGEGASSKLVVKVAAKKIVKT